MTWRTEGEGQTCRIFSESVNAAAGPHLSRSSPALSVVTAFTVLSPSKSNT